MLPPVDTVPVAFELCVIVKTVGVVTEVTWNNLSSKSDALYPVLLGKVTLSNKTMSPPTIESVTKEDQPPTFSGSPYLNLVLSESIQRFSAPTSVSCLSIPGLILKSIRAMVRAPYAVLVLYAQPLVEST